MASPKSDQPLRIRKHDKIAQVTPTTTATITAFIMKAYSSGAVRNSIINIR
jgi:hypothetical protein